MRPPLTSLWNVSLCPYVTAPRSCVNLTQKLSCFGQLTYVKRLEFREDEVEDALVRRLLADSPGGVFTGIVQQNQTSRVFVNVLGHVVHFTPKQDPSVSFDVVSLELLQGNRSGH